MECCCTDGDGAVVIVSEENRLCQLTRRGCGRTRHIQPRREQHDQRVTELMDQHATAAALPDHSHHSKLPPSRRRSSEPIITESLTQEDTAPAAGSAALPFSWEVIAFSLFGRIHPKCKRPWNESLSARIADVQECYKNIPSKLYFSPSSVSFEGIGVYAAELLPLDTSLGPYSGHHVSKDQIDEAEHNQWLWEVYDNNSLSYFVDASNPKQSHYNWMNFIQCARNSTEQNLKLTQINESLYFVATRDIGVGEELLVWYDEVQYGVYMGVPTGFNEIRGPFIETAAMEPGATHGHVCQVSAAYHSQGQTGVATVARNQNDHRLYVQYIHQPTATTNTGHLSDSASTDDSGISLSLEHSRGGPTPPGGHGTLTASFDRISNSSGSSTHLDVTSTTSKHPGADSFHQTHVQEVAVYQTGEIYGSLRVSVPSGSPGSQQGFVAGGQKWAGGGAGKGEPMTGNIWLNPSSVGLVESGLVGGASRKQLLYGMFSRYEDGSRWQCEECKKLFSSQGSLRAHARIHTGERPYQCQYCCRTFCQASTLRSHERLHTGEKPYKCEHCGRAFTQSAGLRSHLKTHRYDS